MNRSNPVVDTPSTNDEPSAKRLILATAATRGANFVVTVIVTLVVSPLLLHGLGESRYGSWALIGQITGYYGLLDWGVRGAVGYYVASLVPQQRFRELDSIVSTALGFLVVVACLVVALGVVLAVGLGAVFNLSGSNVPEVRRAFLLVTFTVACGLPFEVYAAIVNGCRRAYLTSAADTIVRVVSAIGIAFLMARGGGLVGLALIQLASRAVVWLISVWNSRQLLPTLDARASKITKAAGRELAGFGAKSFLLGISGFVINRLDLVVIGAFLDLSLVTRYTIGQTLVEYASGAVSNVTQSFTPHFTHVREKQGMAGVRQLYMRGARLSNALVWLLVGGVLAYGGTFLRIWLGTALVSGPFWERSDTLMLLLLVGQAPRFTQSISWQLLFGLRRLGFLSTVQITEAVCNLACSLWWVRVWGVAGVAAGSTVPMVLTSAVVIPWYVTSLLEIKRADYFKSALLPGLVVGAAVALSGLAMRILVEPTGWLTFTVDVGISGLIGTVVALWVVLSCDDRRDLVVRLQPLVDRLARVIDRGR